MNQFIFDQPRDDQLDMLERAAAEAIPTLPRKRHARSILQARRTSTLRIGAAARPPLIVSREPRAPSRRAAKMGAIRNRGGREGSVDMGTQ
jgi:hypothetical protein